MQLQEELKGNALYIGAAIDTTPIIAFPHIDTWTYIDHEAYEKFKDLVCERLIVLGFTQHIDSENKHTFINGVKKVTYYFGIRFFNKRMLHDVELMDAIKSSTIIVVMGHWPHKKLLDYINEIDALLVDDKTHYESNSQDDFETYALLHHSNINLVCEKITARTRIFQIVKKGPAFKECYWTRILQPDTKLEIRKITDLDTLIKPKKEFKDKMSFIKMKL